MEVEQIYELVNGATEEAIGQSDLVQEDLGNVVDVGNAIFNANAMDKYVKALVNRIGRVIFVNRVYSGQMPRVLVDSWEYGSVLQKIRGDLPEAQENETWELEDGSSYDQDIFTKPEIAVKFFNKMVTFEIPRSIADKQVRQSFTSAQELGSFVDMIFTQVQNSLTLKIERVAHMLVNNMIGEAVYKDFGSASLSSKSGTRAVNLLYLYHQETGDNSVTTANALVKPEFIRFATKIIREVATRMGSYSTLFNVNETEKFTPKDLMRIVFHGDFDASAHAYLYSDTFHKDEVKLPEADLVSFWQGSGEGYAWADSSKIDVKTATGHEVEVSGIIGVIYDRDAMMIRNPDRRVTDHRNAKAEFTNYWFKFDSGYFADLDENFVVFFIA